MFINILEESVDYLHSYSEDGCTRLLQNIFCLPNFAASLSQKTTILFATAVQNFKFHLPVAVNDGATCKLPNVINTS